jgi:UDP-N-acetylglucosamine 2-epimerase (non-hydrolysing)
MVPADYAPPVEVPEEPYGVVSLHRYELLEDRDLLARTLEVLNEHARRKPLLFVDHPVTAAAIDKHGLASSARSLRRIPRLTFFPFIALLRGSEFLFTDSGGSQEECYYLDHPALIHRMKTERREGLGENVVLSEFDFDLVRAFLAEPSKYRRKAPLPDASPSNTIVADLEQRGFV